MLKDTIFREYDIRGIVETELLVDEIYNLTCAMVCYFLQRNSECKKIVLGMDGRLHSDAIKKEMLRALADCGMDVVFIGLCSSPTLYYAVHTLRVDAGLMITASHNPAEYNGIKICLGKNSVWGAEIKNIQSLYYAQSKPTLSYDGSCIEHDMIPEYVTCFKNHFPHLIGMSLPLVVDCGNGSAGTVMPFLCDVMEWKNVTLLYQEVDGTYPHHEADPTKEKNMLDVKKALKQTNAVLGIGFDGDCDRMAAMTKEGYLVPGDQLLAFFAQEVIKNNPGCTIVSDIKSSSAVLTLMAQWGGKTALSPSGHAIIKDSMRTHHALLGGELSCHFFFADRYFGFDDAFYALLRLLERTVRGETVEQFLATIPHTYSSPEYRIDYNEANKQKIIDDLIALFKKRTDTTLITIDGIRAQTPYGWGLVRASNTQASLCLRFESTTQEGLAHIKQDFMSCLEAYINPLERGKILQS